MKKVEESRNLTAFLLTLMKKELTFHS